MIINDLYCKPVLIMHQKDILISLQDILMSLQDVQSLHYKKHNNFRKRAKT